MLSGKKLIISAISLIILIANLTLANWREDAEAIQVCGGEDYTLVLTKNQWLWACGDNEYYQLGIGDTTTDQFSPVRVHDGDMTTESDYIENINDFDAGWMHSLALDINGYVWSWGNNDYGQLGDDSDIPRPTPVRVKSGDQDPGNPDSFLANIVSVACGRSGAHSLAVDSSNYVWAWGQNNKGQLGNGGVGAEQLTPVQTVGGEMGTEFLEGIIAVSGGEDNSIALDVNGFVWTWGLNDYGQLGNGATGGDSDTPVQVKAGWQDPCDPNSFLKDIVAIDCGWDHLLALEKYDPCDPLDPNYDPNYGLGYVYAWGRNENYYSPYGGQLGDGTEDNNDIPVRVLSGQQDPCDPNSYLKYITAVSAGEAHSIALDMFGNVWTWGDNTHGQLGIDSDDPCSLTPVRVNDGYMNTTSGYLENIVAISAGYWHCIAIDSYGTVWTWGKHSVGSLGLGSAVGENDSSTPHPIGVAYNLTQQIFHFGIQSAIDDANSNGDIIEASPAAYFEDVDFLTKTIALKHEPE